MVTKWVELKEQLNGAELLALLQEGNEVILTKDNTAVAKITPIEETVEQSKEGLSNPRIPDLHADAFWMSDDFDDPLPDEFWLGEDDPLMSEE